MPVILALCIVNVSDAVQGYVIFPLLPFAVLHWARGDPTFQPGQDCAPLSSQTANGNATGAGTISVDIFRGAEPSGDLTWGCFAAGDTAPAGITKSTTCYVRVTNDSLFNTNAAVDAPFTITESGGVIPEAPMTILLPTIGGLVAVAGFFFLRRRQAVGA
jgi:hypothetical protein